MDLGFSQADFEFQQEVKQWIAENYPEEMASRHKRSANGHLTKADHVYWQQALYKKGWAGLDWPAELGGPDFTATQRYLFDLEMAAAGTPGTRYHEIRHSGTEGQVSAGHTRQQNLVVSGLLRTRRWL
jgi:alkylation response protein AidB-like acyl-CoA dehydrogenase